MTGISAFDPERAARQAGLGVQILQNCRNELLSLFPHLDGAFACLSCRPWDGSIGTDGTAIFFSPSWLLRRYADDPASLRRGYLHILLHCLFLHLFLKPPADRENWDLACDLSIEHILFLQHQPRLNIPESPLRTACFQILGETPRSPWQLCGMLRDGVFPGSAPDLETAFRFDDHSLWRGAAENAGIRRLWERAAAHANGSRTGRGRAGTMAGDWEESIAGLPRGVHSYRRFLRRFTVSREEVELDLSSFDYIFYHLGMELFGNLPLLEPLEYKEGNKLEELVIAIDTSGSCSKETVARFLSETYGILSAAENFFRRMNVYLIQCDCCVQAMARIRSPEEWNHYSRDIQIQGRGGTDFTPVFRCVEKLRQERKLNRLRALLYFTDGDGVYPREKPDYETAFVFLEQSEHMKKAPPWAVCLVAGQGVVKP